MLQGPSVGRHAPSSQRLRHVFATEQVRTQRRSDGTITVMGVRFELPVRYLSLLRPTVRYARWDLSSVDLVDPRTDTILCSLTPLDKRKNADRQRRTLTRTADEQGGKTASEGGIAPHLQNLMQDYAATGLSLKSHPIAFLREVLTKRGAVRAADLSDPARCPSGRVQSVAGIVLNRQRPGTPT